LKKGWKIVLIVGVGLVLLSLLAVGFTQTKIFRDWLRGYILATVHEHTNADLSLGNFSGSLFTGLTITGASLSLNGEEIFSADVVELRYNPLEIPQRHIALATLVLSHPTVHLTRAVDGEWNFQKLPKQSKAPSSPVSFLKWTLELKSLEVIDGEFSLDDSAAGASYDSSGSSVNPYRRVVLQNINSKMSASLSADNVRISVDRLSLKTPSFSTQFDQFSGKLEYSKEGVRLEDVALRSTGSELRLNARADSLDVLGGLNGRMLQNVKIHADLDVSKVSFDEVHKFIPSFPFQTGLARLNVIVNGTLGNLQLETCNLRTEHSELKLGGRILNILHPNECFLDLSVIAPSLDPQEVAVSLSPLKLPDVSHLEQVSLSGRFKGKLEDFELKTFADFKETGRIEVNGQVDLRGPEPQYEARFSAKDLDLEKLLNDDRLASTLNVTGEVHGKGITLESADFIGTAKVDSSEIFGVPFDNSTVSIATKEKAFDGEASIHSDHSSLQVQYGLDLKDETAPAFDVQGDFSSVDLSRILRNDNYRSTLNGKVTVHGSGKDLDNVTGTMALNFQGSDFRGHKFQGPGVKLTLDQRRDSNKRVVVESPVLDANINGNFHLAPFLSLVRYEVRNILYSLKAKLPFVDTTRLTLRPGTNSHQPSPPQLPALAAQESLNFSYSVDVKNLLPLAIFLGEEDFNAKGSVGGSVTGNADDLLFNANASIDNFVHLGRETRMLITEGKVYVQVDHLKQEDVLDAMETKIDVAASTFLFNSLRMNNLAASVDYLQGRGSFKMSALLDSALSVETTGSVSVKENGYAGQFDSLRVAYRGYGWSNTTPILATIDTSGLSLSSVELAHQGSRLTLSGGMRPRGDLAVEMRLKGFDLADLSDFLTTSRSNGGQRKLGGEASAEATLSGRLNDPVLTIKAASSDLKYGELTFGTLQIESEYREKRARVNLEFKSSSPTESGKPDLLVAGSWPVDLAFTHVEDRFPDAPVDLRVEAMGFHLDLLDPFIPVFDDIEGRLFADVRLEGTSKNLSSSGTMRVEDGKFVFTPNGIKYFVEGTFEPRGDKIQISKLIIRNDPRDEEARGLTVTGDITVQNLFIGSFDLAVKGQLLILKETERKGNTAPYGNLLVGTEGDGLHYHGTIDRSYLTGGVSIRTMAITFPPVALQSTATLASTFSYRVIDDTSKPAEHHVGEGSLSEEFFRQSETKEPTGSEPQNRLNTFDKLLAGMMADVSIETQGPTQLRMIIAYSTGEELFSELHGKLFLTKDEFGTRFTGDVDVGKRSYYYFYKRFDATGKLKFDGPLDNPEMDITATYEGFRTPTRLDSLQGTVSTTKEQHVVVTLKITGTRISPRLAMDMTVDDKEWPGDVQSDAISFILSGKFRDDLTSSERSQMAASLGASVTSTVITGVTSSIFSGVLTDFLRSEFGTFIRQAEVTYSGGSVSESADLRLTGEVGETVIRVGGRVFNDIGNANVNIQMPVGRIIGSPALEDLIIELERKVEGSNYATDQKNLTNGARIYYRISF
jgi:autotransporter translocation and assembly factor TamB